MENRKYINFPVIQLYFIFLHCLESWKEKETQSCQLEYN
jgi:hypothetical protein